MLWHKIQGAGGTGGGGGGWVDPDISSPSFSYGTSTLRSSMRDLAFSADGLNMYVMDGGTDSIYWYELNVAWDLNSGFTQGGSASVSSYESIASGVWMHPDGTKVWYGGTSSDKIHEASLSTAYDITSISSPPSYSTSTLGNIEAICMDPSGTYVYAGSGEIAYQLTLSTPFDLSSYSLTHTTSGLFDSLKETDIEGIWVNETGTKLYILDSKGDEVRQYNMSTAWDLSSKSSSYDVLSGIGASSPSVNGLFFSPDGGTMFVSDDGSNEVNVYTL